MDLVIIWPSNIASCPVIHCEIIIKRIDSVNQDCRCPQCPSKLMFKKASGTTRGHSEKLQTQSAADYRHHFFSTRVIKMWNSLSEDTVQARTVNELKSRLRRDWRGHPDLCNFFKLTSLDKPDKKTYQNKYINRELQLQKTNLETASMLSLCNY